MNHETMTKEESEIMELVNQETKAWDTQNINLLISLFHPQQKKLFLALFR